MSLIDKVFGAETSETVRPDSGRDSSAANLAALKAQAGKGRRRPTKVETALEEQAKAAALDTLFENENWEEIAALYFNARYALTGWEGFKLSEKQERVLGASMGTCMRLLLAIDPRWVALVVFSVNMTAFVTDKELAYRRMLADAQNEAASRKGSENGGTRPKG
jgi:hypothetical protein